MDLTVEGVARVLDGALRAVFPYLFAPGYLGLALQFAGLALLLAAGLTRSLLLARLAVRLVMGGIGFLMIGVGLAGGIGLPLFTTNLAWLLPIFWVIGAAFIAGGILMLRWAIRLDRDPLTQWGLGLKLPDDWG